MSCLLASFSPRASDEFHSISSATVYLLSHDSFSLVTAAEVTSRQKGEDENEETLVIQVFFTVRKLHVRGEESLSLVTLTVSPSNILISCFAKCRKRRSRGDEKRPTQGGKEAATPFLPHFPLSSRGREI